MSEPTQPNLFKSTRFADFKRNLPEVEIKTRVIVTRWITVEGKRFDLDDLYETLSAVRDDNVYITDPNMARVLKDLGVISSAGSNRHSWPADEGENMDEFFKIIQEMYNQEPEPTTAPGLK